MLILLTIFLLLLTPLILLLLHLAWPKSRFQGFLVVMVVFTGWILALLSRAQGRQVISLLNWQPVSLFPATPVLLMDDTSWYFAVALTSLSLALIITSISQLGQSLKPLSAQATQPAGRMADQVPVGTPSSNETVIADMINAPRNWHSWAGMLIFTGLGLASVTAGNLLTLLLAWTALDVFELVILLGQVLDSGSRERIILAFAARVAGIGTVLLAGVIPWSQGDSLSFDAISQSTSPYLLVAAGFRLGVIPIHLPYNRVLPLGRGLGTILRLIPAASSYILLVRVAMVGEPSPASPYLAALALLAGLYAAFNWMNAHDEINGRPYWLLGTASLAVASAVLNHPAACIAWSLASIFSGGLIFSMWIRQKILIPLVVLGLFNLSALPFSPTWSAAMFDKLSSPNVSWMPLWLFYLFLLALLLTHSLLLAGFIRHGLNDITSPALQEAGHIERWVWLFYPLGLAVIVATHFFIGWQLFPGLNSVTLSGWLMGLLAVVISGSLWHGARRYPQILSNRYLSASGSPFNRLISLEWSYPLLGGLFRLLTRLSGLISTVLEGDGGILWAMVLFALIFVFLQR